MARLQLRDFFPQVSYSSPLRSRDGAATIFFLLAPVALWWMAQPGTRGVVFLLASFLGFRALIRAHSLGSNSSKARTSRTSAWGQSRMKSKVTIKFPVPLGKLEKFCAEKQVSVVHVAVKAVAMALRAVPQLNGHSVLGSYFRSATVDVSCEVPVRDEQAPASATRNALVKVCCADGLSVCEISEVVSAKAAAIREGRDVFCSQRERILRCLPVLLSGVLDELFSFLGAGLGLGLPALGIRPYPQGSCTILNPARAEVRPAGSEFVVEHEGGGSGDYLSAPMVLTVGPIFMRPKLEGRVPTLPAFLPIALSIRLHGAEEAAAVRFANRVSAIMTDPATMLEAHEGKGKAGGHPPEAAASF